MPVVIQPVAASDVKDELTVAHREVIHHRLLREAVGTEALQLLGPDDVEVVEHTVGKEEGGHIFVDIEGSGALGAGTESGRVGHNFERFEFVDTKIRHSDSEHRIMAFKDLQANSGIASA